jgi:anthranilate synthase component 1
MSRAGSIPRRDALDALIAGFPAGTVSGAPEGAGDGDHRRAGEGEARPLCGCIGYFGANGEMDTCIVLRTAS